MKRGLTVFFVIASALCGSGLAKNSQEIDLGGLRKARAVVGKDESGYHCSVSFIPVSCFDAQINRQINQRKARSYSARAFASFVGVKGKCSVTIKHLALVEDSGVQEGRAIFLYSAAGVTVAAPSPARHVRKSGVSKIGESATVKDNLVVNMADEQTLLGCHHDYRDTLQVLEQGLFAEISNIDRENLEDQIASAEDRGFSAYEKLFAKVRSEKLLLSVEKEQMSLGVKRSQDAFLKRLGEVYEALSRVSPVAP